MARLKRLDIGDGTQTANELLSSLKAGGMFLNIFRGMANSAAVLDGYLKFSGALNQTSLDGKARHAVALAVGQANKCEYCISAHTMLGQKAGLSQQDTVDARHGKAADKKLAGVIALARQVNEKRGAVSDAELQSARDAGLTDGEIAEVVALVALNVLTNYFNNVNQTDVDVPKVAL